MARHDDQETAYLGEVCAALVAAGMASCLWALSGCARIVLHGYARHGHRRLLQLNLLLFVAVALLAVLLTLLRAYAAAAWVGIADGIGFTGAAWVIDVIYTARSEQQLDSESLGDLLTDSWWHE